MPAVTFSTIESTTEATNSENAGEKPYPTQWTLDTDTTVQRTYYGTYSGTRFFNLADGGQVQNKTSLSNTALLAESKLSPAFTIDLESGEPQVLIMHTHTTESFEPYVRSSFDTSFNYRTTDSAYNVIAVGNAITGQLEVAGIAVIHDTTIHDYPSYNGSYERSAETVKAILAEYPTICVVLDVHRDAIQDGNTLLQPMVEIDVKESAQVMIISGCDDGTMNMPQYLQNFHFACRFQSSMESRYPGLTRPILFDYRKYNQDLTTGSLLIEVGTHGNTLEQVVYAGELVGKSLAETLLQLDE
ncbi:MAG: stage II sporulation protein P [Ruminococcus sp.]|nr:stage II sporulation protein P [Ruminococcus sp.]